MKLWLAIFVFFLGIASLHPTTAIAQSGVGNQSLSLFNEMINVTDPAISMTARRGVITGGGIQIRNQMTNIPFYNLQMPRFNAGCGGIDAFFGSFTFISSQQLVAALRNIASAALGYAFQLALKAMCPTCEDVMSKLQAMLNGFNSGQMNTCALSQKLLTSTGADKSIDEAFSAIGSQTGLAGWSNYWDTKVNGSSSDSTTNAFANAAPSIALQLLAGNVFWKATTQSNISGWFSTGVDSYLQSDLMSLTGTLIVCLEGKLGCPTGDPSVTQTGQPAALVRIYKKKLLTAHDLIYGSKSSTTIIHRYVCDNPSDPNGCLNPTETPVTDLIGVKDMIENMMLGVNGSEGIIYAMASGDRAPTSAETGLMSRGGEYIQLALALARKRPAAAKEYIRTFSPVIAAEFLTQMVDADLDLALSTLSNKSKEAIDSGSQKEMRAMIQQAQKDVESELNLAYFESQNKSSVLSYFTNQRDVMQRSNPPVQPVGSN